MSEEFMDCIIIDCGYIAEVETEINEGVMRSSVTLTDVDIEVVLGVILEMCPDKAEEFLTENGFRLAHSRQIRQ